MVKKADRDLRSETLVGICKRRSPDSNRSQVEGPCGRRETIAGYGRLCCMRSTRRGEPFVSMSYQARQVGDVTILDIAGRIDVGVDLAFGAGGETPLREVVREFARQGQKKIVLNLHDVSYIDSSGIGEL